MEPSTIDVNTDGVRSVGIDRDSCCNFIPGGIIDAKYVISLSQRSHRSLAQNFGAARKRITDMPYQHDDSSKVVEEQVVGKVYKLSGHKSIDHLRRGVASSHLQIVTCEWIR